METNNHRHKKKLFFTKDSHNPPITLLENKTTNNLVFNLIIVTT